MREIEPGDIHAGLDHFFQHSFVIGRRTNRADDLSFFHDYFLSHFLRHDYNIKRQSFFMRSDIPLPVSGYGRFLL